jgi:hypothetical protein
VTANLNLGGANGFELWGHDCPLGVYPSIAVPVGTVGEEVVAVYNGEIGSRFHVVRPDLRYKRHNRLTSSTLQGFDPLRHGLFAFKDELVIYDLGQEREFYARLLRHSPAFYIEPYYRLSLAFETEELSLIRPVYFSCIRHMMRDAPEFTDTWTKAAAAARPICEALRNEWLSQTEGPRHQRATATSATAALERGPTPRPWQIPSYIGARMSSASVNRAFDQVALRDLLPRIGPSGPYSKAILISLGFSESGGPAPESEHPPNVEDVARISGLSLPHLEFLNIILSKTTAAQFLRISESGLPNAVLSGELLRPATYERQFGRRAVRIKRRLVLTYAEVLSMVGYHGPLDLPAGI